MAGIPITGVSSSFVVPGVFVELNFAQGPSNSAAGIDTICIVAPKSETGTWTAATRYGPIASEADVVAGAGPGSPAHIAYRGVMQKDRTHAVYIVPIAETVTSTAVKGTFAVTFTTTPTKAGRATVYVDGKPFSYDFDNGTVDTVTTIAAGLKAAVNSDTNLAITSDNSLGVWTGTAKIAGISQGDGTIKAIRIRTEISSGCGTTVSASGYIGGTVVGAEGTTTETANLTAALATLTGVRHYWYVGTCSDATGYAAWEAHVTTKSYARPGLRCQAILAFAGTQALAQTRAIAQNYERLTLVHQTGCDVHPAFLAGGICGELAMGYDADPSANLNGLQLNWLPPAPLASEWPDDDDINSALCDGVTIIRSTETGAYMVKHVTTRSKDSTGTYADRRAWSGHKIKAADSFCDTVIARHAAQFQGYKLKDDKRDSTGKIDGNQYIPAKTTTPSLLKKWAIGIVREYGENGLNVLQNEDATIASMRFQRDPNNVNRVEAAINIEVIDHHDQSTFRVDEVSAG